MKAGRKAPEREGAENASGERPRHPSRKGLGLAVRGRKIEQFLASAAWEAHGELFGYRQTEAKPFPLELQVMVEPGPRWRVMAEPSLEEQIRRGVRDMVAQAEAFHLGRVFCYRCDSSDCPHSAPPRPTSVFGGYAPTGLPRWPELGQLLLDLKHPKVDLLYESGTRELAAAYMDGEYLKGPQLNVFGRHSRAYNILGQAVFGFMRLYPPHQGDQEPVRVALTVQAVESCRLDGSPRLDLNVLGRLWDDSPVLLALGELHQSRILDIIAETRRGIQGIGSSGEMRHGPRQGRLHPDAGMRVARALKEMARSVERLGRQAVRRTAHAEERRADNRPTSKALEDACTVPEDRLLWDEHKGTVVVIGPRNRVHVFSLDGRHVTSLALEGETIQGRLRRRRWRRLIGDPLERFRVAVGRVRG